MTIRTLLTCACLVRAEAFKKKIIINVFLNFSNQIFHNICLFIKKFIRRYTGKAGKL